MSATAERAPVSRWWLKWRFHLGALMVVVPLACLPNYLASVALHSGESGLGSREIGERTAGPWTVRLAEHELSPPGPHQTPQTVKTFELALTGAAVNEVRSAYIAIGRPPESAPGLLFKGSPYRMAADLPVPDGTAPDAELWLTLEGWNGSVHQTSLPFSEASPVSAEWLKARAAGAR
ncbi:MAG TPA: thiamine pyrophosphate-binding protein [Hansschlegelia sp.]